ncbi:MAG TPA: glycoside hydrolase family 3 N-terminal domain-containing protein [Ktedonobacterales bacterium]
MDGRGPWMQQGAGRSGDFPKPPEGPAPHAGDAPRMPTGSPGSPQPRAGGPLRAGAPQPWAHSGDPANEETILTPTPPAPVDAETVLMRSPTAGPPLRATPARTLKAWQTRVLFLAALLALVGRAALASATFMNPGGEIIGWSKPIAKTCSLCVATLPVTTKQLTPEEYAATIVSHMSLNDQLGQMMVMQFLGSYPSPDALRMVAEQGAGGVLYFGFNISSAAQVTESTHQLQSAASIPMLISVDQEGGPVNRFRGIVGELPSASSITSADEARARGAQDAVYLAKYGFNLDLAPVADVKDPAVYNVQFAGRTFGSDPTTVAQYAGAYLDGLQAGAITSCVKHFPGGFTSSNTDPHTGLPTLLKSIADWRQSDVAPYRTLLAQHDVRMIMVSHEMIPAIDKTYPTSLSPAIIDGLLRNELGFQGVVMTDSLYMGALNARWSVAQAAVLAVHAGADMLIGPSSTQQMADIKTEMNRAIADGTLSSARIAQSAQRIITLKLKMGLIPMPKSATMPTVAPTVTATPAHIRPTPTHTATPKPTATP